MKKSYIIPKTNVVKVVPVTFLSASAGGFASQFGEVWDEADKEGWAIQLCPFNHQLCYDKQKRFNDWCRAVRYFAKNQVNQTFYTMANMFDDCPHGYTRICALHKEKQRG